jgi:hypothetical protein
VLSLAGFRYRSVLSKDGGPIESIEEGRMDVFGSPYSQANARLTAGLCKKRIMQMYSDADGTGMSRSPSVARHIAVSEALERWAYSATMSSCFRNKYGLNIDPSSNGFAAFPGISKRAARDFATLEAVERVILLNWWERKIDGIYQETPWPGISAVAFEIKLGAIVVILVSRIGTGIFAYGHAAGHSIKSALEKALLEARRHEWTTKAWLSKESPTLPTNLFERRSLFFSTDAGYKEFMDRVETPTGTRSVSLELICDSEIIGPWSRYATVWRTLFRPPSTAFFEADERFFYW